MPAATATTILTPSLVLGVLEAVNRNARKPKRANGGKRAVSNVNRRNARRAPGNHRR